MALWFLWNSLNIIYGNKSGKHDTPIQIADANREKFLFIHHMTNSLPVGHTAKLSRPQKKQCCPYQELVVSSPSSMRREWLCNNDQACEEPAIRQVKFPYILWIYLFTLTRSAIPTHI